MKEVLRRMTENRHLIRKTMNRKANSMEHIVRGGRQIIKGLVECIRKRDRKKLKIDG